MLPSKKNNKGFTIIEVMIVLAIGGLIMALVFLAVPALQRNSRNNARRSDISRVGAAVNEWIANNNGQQFTAGTANANLTTVANSVGTNLGYYDNLTAGTIGAAGVNLSLASGTRTALTTDVIVIVTNSQCSTNGATTAPATINNRLMVIQYQIESGSGNTGACQNI